MIDLTHVISNSTNLCERALICVGWLVDQHWMNLLAPSLKKSAWALLVVNPKNVQFIATAPRLEQILTDRWRHFQADDSQSIIHIRVIVWFKTDLSVTNDSDTWLIPDDSFLDDSLWIWCGSYFKTIWSLNWIWESVKKLRKASSVNFNRISEGRDIITFSTNQIRSSVPTNERQEMFEAEWFILKGEEYWRAANIFLQVDAGYIKVRYHFINDDSSLMTLDDLSWPLKATIDHQLRQTNSVNELNHEETVKVQERIGRKNRLRSCRSISESDLSNQSYSCRRKCSRTLTYLKIRNYGSYKTSHSMT